MYYKICNVGSIYNLNNSHKHIKRISTELDSCHSASTKINSKCFNNVKLKSETQLQRVVILHPESIHSQ